MCVQTPHHEHNNCAPPACHLQRFPLLLSNSASNSTSAWGKSITWVSPQKPCFCLLPALPAVPVPTCLPTSACNPQAERFKPPYSSAVGLSCLHRCFGLCLLGISLRDGVSATVLILTHTWSRSTVCVRTLHQHLLTDSTLDLGVKDRSGNAANNKETLLDLPGTMILLLFLSTCFIAFEMGLCELDCNLQSQD